jgi:hypothetical protein
MIGADSEPPEFEDDDELTGAVLDKGASVTTKLCPFDLSFTTFLGFPQTIFLPDLMQVYLKLLTVFIEPIFEHIKDGAAVAALAYTGENNKVEAKRQMMALRIINKFYSQELISSEIDE